MPRTLGSEGIPQRNQWTLSSCAVPYDNGFLTALSHRGYCSKWERIFHRGTLTIQRGWGWGFKVNSVDGFIALYEDLGELEDIAFTSRLPSTTYSAEHLWTGHVSVTPNERYLARTKCFAIFLFWDMDFFCNLAYTGFTSYVIGQVWLILNRHHVAAILFLRQGCFCICFVATGKRRSTWIMLTKSQTLRLPRHLY